MSGHLKYDVTTGRLLYSHTGHLVHECIFTATAGLTVGPATLSATATFTAPVYTGTSVLTAGAATLNAVAFHAEDSDCVIDIGAGGNTSRSINMLVWTTPEIGYAFFIDHDQSLRYRKTTDGGTGWGPNVEIHGASVIASDVWYDRWTPGISGTIAHLFYADQGTDIVYYRTFDTSTDTLGTERTVYAGATFNSVLGNFVSGAKMRGGNLLCCFGQGAAQLGTYRSTDGGATWGSRTNVMEAFGDVAKVYPGSAADDQDASILYQDISADELTIKVHDDSADTNSESLLMALVEGFDITGPYGFSGAVRHSDNHLIVAAIAEQFSSNSDFRVFDADGTAFTEKTALATDKNDIYHPSVYVDSSNQIYVAHIGKRDGTENLGTTARVYYSLSTDGGTTWGSDQVVSADLRDWRQTWCAPSGPNFSVVYRDASSNALYLNCHTSIVIHTATAALTAGAATLSAVGAGDTVYTATSVLTAGAAILFAVANSEGEIFHTGIATLTAGAATLSASASFGTTVHTATSVLTAGAAVLEGHATFVERQFGTAVGTLIAAPATLSASATHTPKTYTATSALTAGAATLSASATFTEEAPTPSIGQAAFTTGAATLSANATHDPRTYTGVAAFTVGAATLNAVATHTEPPPNGPCTQCELNTTPPYVVVRLGGTAGAGTCSAAGCLDIIGDYVLPQGGPPPNQDDTCIYYAEFVQECGTLIIQHSFLQDLSECVVGYEVNGVPTGTVAYQKALTSPYDCTEDILGSYTQVSGSSTTCTFTNVTLELVREPCGHCTGTVPNSLELILTGVTNDTCGTCSDYNAVYTLNRVGGNFPCHYEGESSGNCGNVQVEAELLDTGIVGKFKLDTGGGNYETMFTFSVALTAPYDCTIDRTPTAANKLTTPCNFTNVGLTWNIP